ncbi:MAG: hypothetical protein E6J88_16640, partial [Deltaproteobacteria bacterium]
MLAELVQRLLDAIAAVDLRAHLFQLDGRARDHARVADRLQRRDHVALGDLAHPALGHGLGGGLVRRLVLVARERQRLALAVLLRSLADDAGPLGLADELLLRLGVVAVDAELLDLRVRLDAHLHLAQAVAGTDGDAGARRRRPDDELFPLDPQVVAVLLREPPQERRVGHVALEDVLLGPRGRVGRE